MMKIELIPTAEQHRFYDQILEMMYAADDEFYPPLSARSSTTQKDLSKSEKSDDGILQYFEQLKSQRFMVAYEDERLLAFVSYKENYTNEHIGADGLPNIYLSTLIVRPEGRGRGLTTTMYGNLFTAYENANVFTRTWSTNVPHIKILDKFGFEVIEVLKNDRGEGMDTVYFKRKAQKEL